MQWLIEKLLRNVLASLPVQGLRGVLALVALGVGLLLVGHEAALRLLEWLSITLGSLPSSLIP